MSTTWGPTAIATGSDDAYQFNAAMTLGSSVITVATTGSTSYRNGYRFLNVTVPKNPNILTATFRFKSSSTFDGIHVNWYGVLEANTGTFTVDDNNISSRPKTDGIEWQMPNEVPDGWYDSPNFAALIQPIVNQSGWESGNALALVTDVTDTPANDYVIYAYETAGNAALLTIEWEPGGGGTPETLVAFVS